MDSGQQATGNAESSTRQKALDGDSAHPLRNINRGQTGMG